MPGQDLFEQQRMPPETPECRLFVYGTLRQGEAQHALLAGASLLGVSSTRPAFHLIDVGPYAALVRGGTTAVSGELYSVGLQTRRAIGDIYGSSLTSRAHHSQPACAWSLPSASR